MDIPMINKRAAESLCEVVSDITTNVYCHLNNMEEDEREALMDAIEGSRGLFWQHVLPWAKAFQTKWVDHEQLGGERDYLIAIDEFTKTKFDELLKEPAKKVVSIQVVPTVHLPDGLGGIEIIAQFDGPAENTTHWSVYERGSDGLANWVADFCKDWQADMFGVALAVKYLVPIEPQPWKQVKQAEVVKEVPQSEERFHVSWTIDIDAVSARDAALKAQEIQRRPDGTATVFAVHARDGFVTEIDVSEQA